MVGETIELEALKTTPQGVYLITVDEQEILLPNKYVPKSLKIGEKIEVFIYTDSEDRLIATTLEPKIRLNNIAYLTCVDVNKFGAFFDWGMEKDLMVPFSEQALKVKPGNEYLIYLYKDIKTNRLVGSTKVAKYLNGNKVELNQGDKVDLLISGETEIGYRVIVEGKYFGMLFKNEVFKPVNPGDKLVGYVQKIREDNKVDVTLNSARLNDVEVLANKIYELLLKEKGAINISDKSEPEVIYKVFGVSKKAFRRAVGLLYSERKITINPQSIVLVED